MNYELLLFSKRRLAWFNCLYNTEDKRINREASMPFVTALNDTFFDVGNLYYLGSFNVVVDIGPWDV